MFDEPSGTSLPLPHIKKLKANLFTGRVTLVGSANQRWCLHFYLGRLLYATGGHHAMRRWLRQLSLHYSPDFSDPHKTENIQNLTDISQLNEFEIFSCWEYFLLRDSLQNNEISREKVTAIVQEILLEVLFDIQQADALIEDTICQEQLNPQLVLFDTEQLWAVAHQAWRQWKKNRLATVFPDRAAVISRSARLRQEMSPAAYQALSSLLDGQRSLREISAQTGRSTLVVATSLLMYVEAGNITLVEVPDLIDPAERFYSQSGNLLATHAAIGNSPRAQNFAQRTRVAG
jgi:two-component system, chemotaxis family, response regulator PixG